jgi:serine/threonine protein kinase
VYSLGIMLFELLYPMYTGMERSLCLGRLRNGKFPGDWQYSSFPSLQELILRMLSTNPADRPSAGEVATHIESILSEFTIVSLDQRKFENNTDAVILLRVEAAHNEDTLKSTMDCIQTKDAKIIEYGLRVVNDTSIMEFAIQNTNAELIPRLQRHPSIFKVRQVSISSSASS